MTRPLLRKILPWAVFLAAIAAVYLYRGRLLRLYYAIPMPTTVDQGLTAPDVGQGDVVEVAKDLKIPWALAFLPDGDMLVTERPGTLRRIGQNGAVIAIEGVAHVGEGGLLGLVLHPKFAENGWLYLYLTSNVNGVVKNRVDRYRLEGDRVTDRTTIVQNIPGGPYHDGGALAFGPDGMLYVTTGDAGEPFSAQNRNSLAGKILRLKDDGTIPSDNPFGTAVWSYGHRNVQGLAWEYSGRLWAVEHGRSGVQSGLDELNLIERGKNYGWPSIQGDETAPGMEPPVVHSGPWETWAPAGAVFFNGRLFFTGLRGESLYQATIIDKDVKIQAHFQKEYGRLRAVAVGPDRQLYVTTSNTDGRGEPRPGDDKILRVNTALFN